MPLQHTWALEPYIRHHLYFGKITSADIDAMIQEELTLLRGAQNNIYYLGEFRNVESIPANLGQIPFAIEFIKHPHMGGIAFWGVPKHINFWVPIFNKLSNSKLFPAQDYDNAQSLLEHLIEIEKQKIIQ